MRQFGLLPTVSCVLFPIVVFVAGSTGAPHAALADVGWGLPEVNGLRVGGVASVRPTYEGSDEYEVTGFPLLIPVFGDAGLKDDGGLRGFFRTYVEIGGIDDVRLKLLQGDVLTAGPLVGYRFGRDEDDGDLLAGLGDIDGGVIAGGFVRASLIDGFFAEVSYHRQISGDEEGGEARLALGTEQDVADGVTLKAKVGATYADDEYMTTYFGVTAAQSNSSGAGLGVYDPEAGFKSAFVEAGAEIALGYAWVLQPTVRYTHLVGDAADSPLVAEEAQFSGRLGLSYRFDFR